MKVSVSGRPYWWQWYTILSLDATIAALAWQALFFHVAGAPMRGAHAFILGASVWLAYTADRWIEGWRLSPERARTQRHYFAVRWRWPLLLVWCLVLAADLGVSFLELTEREFVAGLLLLGPVGAYLLSHQLVHRHHPWRLPKELCVAGLMVGGAAVFPLAQPGVPAVSLAGVSIAFGALCFANCALIAFWEHEVDSAHGQESLARRYTRAEALARWLPWGLGLAALVGALVVSPPGWNQRALECVAGSSGLLGLLDLLEPRLGWQLARVLADVVLLTPLLALAYARA